MSNIPMGTASVSGKQPRPSIHIRPAENGYIIEREGANTPNGYEVPEPYICTNEAEVAEAVKAILTGFHPFS